MLNIVIADSLLKKVETIRLLSQLMEDNELESSHTGIPMRRAARDRLASGQRPGWLGAPPGSRPPRPAGRGHNGRRSYREKRLHVRPISAQPDAEKAGNHRSAACELVIAIAASLSAFSLLFSKNRWLQIDFFHFL